MSSSFRLKGKKFLSERYRDSVKMKRFVKKAYTHYPLNDILKNFYQK